jgi:hypothetical protein
LKTPIIFHDKEDIDNLFLTCVALQNIISTWEGKDLWNERGVSWDKHDGLFDDDDDDQVNWARPRIFRDGQWVKAQPGDDFSNIGRASFAENQQVLWGVSGASTPTSPAELKQLVELHTESDKKFLALQSKLVTNFNLRLRDGSVHWLRS